MAKFCSNCGVPVKSSQKFCDKCGEKVSSVESPAKPIKTLDVTEKKKTRKTGLFFLYLFFILATLIWFILMNNLFSLESPQLDVADNLALMIFSISILILAIGYMLRHYYEKRLGLKISELKKLFASEKKLENSEEISEEEKKFIEENKEQLKKWNFTKKNLRNIRVAFIMAVTICLLGFSVTAINSVIPDPIGTKSSDDSDDSVNPPSNKSCPQITIKYCYTNTRTSVSAFCWVTTGKSSNWDLNGTSMHSDGEGDGTIPLRCIPSGTVWK